MSWSAQGHNYSELLPALTKALTPIALGTRDTVSKWVCKPLGTVDAFLEAGGMHTGGFAKVSLGGSIARLDRNGLTYTDLLMKQESI